MDLPGTESPAGDPAVFELTGRLAADLAALLATVAGLSQAQADWRPAEGRWSVGEILHHLCLSNSYFAASTGALIERGEREALLAGPTSRRVWPRLRLVADATASGPVAHPSAATPTHGLPLADLVAEVGEWHAAVAALLPRIVPLDLAALRAPHPLGFELNLFQWFDMMGAHERRHLLQIHAIRDAGGFPAE